MTDREQLAARIEAATGPDRELDAAIYQMLNPHMLPVPGDRTGRFYDPAKTNPRTAQKFFLSGGATGLALSYTASLDAAMMLVPEPFRKTWSLVGGTSWQAEVGECLADTATPALALAAAAIRAGGA